MQLRTFDGMSYDVARESTGNCIIMETTEPDGAAGMLSVLTDANLAEYDLVAGDVINHFERGHLFSSSTSTTTGKLWRTNFYIKTLEDTTDYRAIAEEYATQLAETRAELTENERALAILFGEEE